MIAGAAALREGVATAETRLVEAGGSVRSAVLKLFPGRIKPLIKEEVEKTAEWLG